MNNKGYTIMEAVIAMFLVVVMVGAVFSALMSSRRAIISSSEKEEMLYSLDSAYAMIKDCRSNPTCHLQQAGCAHGFSSTNGVQDLKSCNDLFTFNFQNLCTNTSLGALNYTLSNVTGPTAYLGIYNSAYVMINEPLHGFYTLNITASCSEE